MFFANREINLKDGEKHAQDKGGRENHCQDKGVQKGLKNEKGQDKNSREKDEQKIEFGFLMVHTIFSSKILIYQKTKSARPIIQDQ